MNNSELNRWQHLVNQYLNNTISREELDELLHQVNSQADLGTLSAALKDNWDKAASMPDPGHEKWEGKFRDMMLEAKTVAPFTPEGSTPVRRLLKRFTVAASILLVLGTAAYFLFFQNREGSAQYEAAVENVKKDILPGSSGAILTLANGEEIMLDSAGNGVVATQGKSMLISKNGQIVYAADSPASEVLLYNTIVTPRGRQFKLTLSDGSQVWLNAGSSLRYPATFSETERKVDVTGEAYFEVKPAYTAEHKKIPFIVNAAGAEIQVLGTHFNVNAYSDEAMIQTTLLEGSVKISKGGHSGILLPGQQAQIDKDNKLNIVREVNTDVVLAWKNGYFSFDETNLYAVMRQISRWYDVDIEYEGNIPDRTFGGEISRNTNASQVLQILEESNIHFKIEDKKIIVLP